MEVFKGFYDLCIPYNRNHAEIIKMVRELIELGYRTIAIEQFHECTKKATTAKKGTGVFPDPVDIDFLAEYKNKIKILRRITICYSDVGISHQMMSNSSTLKKYDLIAGLPRGDAALTHLCTIFEGDIICFDPEDSKLLVNRKTYKVAVKRGMRFEIKYAQAIMNSNHRKNMIKIAHNYHSRGKSKNVIFSSGAENPFQLRGPYDIANLSLIFGLTEEQGKSAISTDCRLLCLKAESRRVGKTIMFVRNKGVSTVLSSTSEDEQDSENNTSDSDDDPENTNLDEAMEEDITAKEKETEDHPHKKKKLN